MVIRKANAASRKARGIHNLADSAQVKNLRQRIYKAIMNGDWKKVRGLQKLVLRSRANLLVSVRRATQINRGQAATDFFMCRRQSLHNSKAIDLRHLDGDRQHNSYGKLSLVHAICNTSFITFIIALLEPCAGKLARTVLRGR